MRLNFMASNKQFDPYVAEFHNSIKLCIAAVVFSIIISFIIPFVAGYELSSWHHSSIKQMLESFAIMGVIFIVLPLFANKGTYLFKQLRFTIPLILTVLSATFSQYIFILGSIPLFALIYIHFQFSLADFGFRTKNWKKEALAILAVATISLLPILLMKLGIENIWFNKFSTASGRILGNSTALIKSFFFFGFLMERLLRNYNKYISILLIAAMFSIYEVCTTAFWIEDYSLIFIIPIVLLLAVIYTWTRSVVVIWLGVGAGRLIPRLLN